MSGFKEESLQIKEAKSMECTWKIELDCRTRVVEPTGTVKHLILRKLMVTNAYQITTYHELKV